MARIDCTTIKFKCDGECGKAVEYEYSDEDGSDERDFQAWLDGNRKAGWIFVFDSSSDGEDIGYHFCSEKCKKIHDEEWGTNAEEQELKSNPQVREKL